MQKDFITATPDTGSGNGSVNVTASKNTGAARETYITISGGGVTKRIPINQKIGFSSIIAIGSSGNIVKVQLE